VGKFEHSIQADLHLNPWITGTPALITMFWSNFWKPATQLAGNGFVWMVDRPGRDEATPLYWSFMPEVTLRCVSFILLSKLGMMAPLMKARPPRPRSISGSSHSP
jgi:hypothetical protein